MQKMNKYVPVQCNHKKRTLKLILLHPEWKTGRGSPAFAQKYIPDALKCEIQYRAVQFGAVQISALWNDIA